MRKMLVLLGTAMLAVSLAACATESDDRFTRASLSDPELQEMVPRVLSSLNRLDAWKFSNISSSGRTFGDNALVFSMNFELEHLTDIPIDESRPRADYLNHFDSYSFSITDVQSDPPRATVSFHAGKIITGELVKQSGVYLNVSGDCQPHFWLAEQRSICGALPKEKWAELSTKALALSRSLRGGR